MSDGLFKIIRLDERFPETGEPTIQILSQTDLIRVKLASEASDYIKTVQPVPGKTIVLVLAMSASEFYGPNRNGDGFAERPIPGKVEQGETLPDHYKTFETGAHVFRHHANKDPAKAIGRVLKAFYNWDMHRVELLLELDNDLAHDVVDRINKGEYPACSMGCRIRYDVCDICGNKAPTRAQYCFPPGTKITLADGTRKVIEEIEKGDLVLDAAGKPTEVIKPVSHEINDELVSIRHSISGTLIRATKEHPFLSSLRENYCCYYRVSSSEVRNCFPGSFEHCASCKRTEPQPSFVEAKDLRINDSLYAPALLSNNTRQTLSEVDAYVIGIFMAEGSYAKQNDKYSSAQFALHEDEDHVIEAISEFAAKFNRDAKVYRRDESKGISVRIHSQEVAEFFFRYCGAYAHKKKASYELVTQPDNVVLAYLNGLWDGDGYNKNSTSRLNTASEDLAWQTAGLLRRLDYSSYVGRALVPGGPSSRSNKFTQWYVSTDFRATSKRQISPILPTKSQIGFIKEIKTEPYKGRVYNFETASHTYVAEGVAVHNCDHAKYEMNRVYPDGRKSFVWNPSPNLFDISIVIRPADRIGYMMKKVAHDNMALALSADEGDKIADIQEKLSTLKKLSDIDKVIRGQTVDFEPKNGPVHNFVQSSLPGLMARSPGFDQQAISDLASVPLPEALSTLGGLGITPTSGEITCIIVRRALPGKEMPQGALQNISNFSGGALELLRQNPDILNAVLQSGLLDIGPDRVNPQLAQKMAAWVEKRANTIEYLGRRVFTEPHPMVGNWETVTGTDPEGRPLQTTRGAIDAADDASVGRQLKTLGGVGLLTGAAYKALSSHPTGKYMAPLAVAAGGMTGANIARRYNTPRVGDTGKIPVDVMTGEMWQGGIPVNAEMKVGSAIPGGNFMNIAIPGVSSAAATAMLAQEYNQRLRQGQLGQNPDIFNKTVEGLGSVAYRHPAATFLAGLAGIGLGAHTIGNVSRFITKGAEDSVKLASVDLDGLCLWLGEGLFEFGKT